MVHRNAVPSTHMRCMITANRRASATIAFFIPRCLAIFIAKALSQDYFVKRLLDQRALLPGRLSTLSILLVGPCTQTTLIASVCARSRPIELSAT